MPVRSVAACASSACVAMNSTIAVCFPSLLVSFKMFCIWSDWLIV